VPVTKSFRAVSLQSLSANAGSLISNLSLTLSAYYRVSGLWKRTNGCRRQALTPFLGWPGVVVSGNEERKET
jgi:hypothetical protein